MRIILFKIFLDGLLQQMLTIVVAFQTPMGDPMTLAMPLQKPASRAMTEEETMAYYEKRYQARVWLVASKFTSKAMHFQI